MGIPEERALADPPELVTLNGACTEGATHTRTVYALPDLDWIGKGRKALSQVTRFHVMLGLGMFIVIVGLTVFIVASKCNQCNEHQTMNVQSRPAETGKDREVLPPCDDDWIWYWNKCYYFSEDAGNWTVAKDSCAALNSSLALIDTHKDLDFLLRHKGDPDRWIGLRRRDPGQPWIWVDGTQFNNMFMVQDHSECAYLGPGVVKSSECYSKRRWSCSRTPYERKCNTNH